MFVEPLSRREAQVLSLVSQGKRNKEIAAQLAITENTVETHLRAIFKKLRVRNRLEAALTAPQMQSQMQMQMQTE